MQRTNPYLLCFKNGVLDIKEKKFRPIREDDYFEKCTNIDYIPIDHQKHKKTIDEINDFMTILFPSPQKREYMWEHLASILIGGDKGVWNQDIHFYNGSGPNGKSLRNATSKSIIIYLLSQCLGDYYTEVPYSLLQPPEPLIYSSKKNSLNNIMLKLKESRLAVIYGPPISVTLNSGWLKSITSGCDVVNVIGLNGQPITFIPHFKIVVCSNNLNLMNVNDTTDGIWRRIAVVDFNAKIDYPLMSLVDYDMNEKILIWREVFMSMLVDIVLKTQGDVKRCEIIIDETSAYRNKQDLVSEFINSRIQFKEGGKIQKTPLSQEYKLHLHRKVRKSELAELEEAMNKKFGEYDSKKKCWKNVKLIYDGDEDDE